MKKATLSCHQLRLPHFELAGEEGEGLTAPSCFPRDLCQMPAPRARGSPAERGHYARGAPSPGDDLPGGCNP